MGKYLIETTKGGNLHYVVTETGEHIYERSRDIVEVVRCKDCRWYKTNYMWNGTEVKICAREAYEPRRNADDFCSYGERKDD